MYVNVGSSSLRVGCFSDFSADFAVAFEIGAMVLDGTEGFGPRTVGVHMSKQLTFIKDRWKTLFPVVGMLDEPGGACQLDTKP